MIKTQWCVITGAPSSGKTTLINHLAGRGYKISPEVARDCIEHELLAHHHNFAEIEQSILQQTIANEMSDRETLLPHSEIIFFDRGLPDSLAYYRFHQLDPQSVRKACETIRYLKVFFCHGLPLAQDPIRIEDEREAKTIGEYIYQSYADLGYELIELPALSVEERLKIILENQSVKRSLSL
ncbi:MAG: ATPase [Legionella sp.]|nr:MAG: ATPase [Legionella sp.]